MSDSYTNTNTRADTLNQGSAHDTGFYDPNVHDNHIVALYDSEPHARAARDTLVANGVPQQAIRITDREQDRFVGGVDYEHNDGGLWGAIRSLFVPDAEAHGYAEGVRRGHAMVVVQPDATMDRHRVIELLEGTHPLDFDAKLEEWRQAGYDYSGAAVAAGATGAAMGTPMTGVATDTSAMRATDTTAAGTFRNAPSSSAAENGHMSGARADDLPGGASEARSGSVGAAPTSTASANASSAGSSSADGRTTPPIMPATVTGNVQSTTAASAGPGSQDETVTLVEEQLRVGKREVVKGAVRVRSYVVERPVEQQIRLHEERVNVERRPVDQPTTAADDTLFQEHVIEARSTNEEAVIAKEARVTEEIALRKQASDRTETVHETLRKTEVEIEGDPAAGSGT
jgi:uncharacterized protein (TIGR02271 family)